MFELARNYKANQMTAYVALQQAEFAAESTGYTATRHQREVGAGYFDAVTQVIASGGSSLGALQGSTEEQQFRSA
jgi:isocitrate lyase